MSPHTPRCAVVDTFTDSSYARSSRMRAHGIKITCYLNTECDRGRATVIHLPDECDTLGEVLPKIQHRMQLRRGSRTGPAHKSLESKLYH